MLLVVLLVCRGELGFDIVVLKDRFDCFGDICELSCVRTVGSWSSSGVFGRYLAGRRTLDEGAESLVCGHVWMLSLGCKKLSAMLCSNCELEAQFGECCGGEVNRPSRLARGPVTQEATTWDSHIIHQNNTSAREKEYLLKQYPRGIRCTFSLTEFSLKTESRWQVVIWYVVNHSPITTPRRRAQP